MRVLTRGVSVALLVGCVASAVALAQRSGDDDRPGARPASNEKVRVAIASGRLLFVGASYTAGLGATTPQAGYAPVLASDLDRRFALDAVSGTGFLNPGQHHQGTFGERIARLPADLDPRIVVIQGGRNDTGYPQRDLQAAARDTITLAQHRFEHAQVVVMGPIPAYVPASQRLLQTRDIVRAAARQTGAGFVDPIAQTWITRANQGRFAGPVPAHPNDAGYRYIASRLLEDLPAALEESQPPLTVDVPGATTVIGTPVPGWAGATPGERRPEPSADAGEQPAVVPPDAHAAPVVATPSAAPTGHDA